MNPTITSIPPYVIYRTGRGVGQVVEVGAVSAGRITLTPLFGMTHGPVETVSASNILFAPIRPFLTRAVSNMWVLPEAIRMRFEAGYTTDIPIGWLRDPTTITYPQTDPEEEEPEDEEYEEDEPEEDEPA